MAEELNDKRHRALLDSVVKARADFESLQDDAETAKRGYYDAVRALHESGMPLREIAQHLGLSHQRVHQILGMESPRKKKRSGKAMGAAGIVVALVLSTISIFAAQDEDPPPPPRTERVELVNQAPISNNDVRAALRYERPLTSGTVDGVRWSLMTTTLNGIYCHRLEFTPGPKRQGRSCSQIPLTNVDEEDVLQTGFLPSTMKPQLSPRPLIYGASSYRTSSVRVETCEGFEKEVSTIPLPEARITFFIAFLSEPATGAALELRDAAGRTLLKVDSPPCDAAPPPDRHRRVRPPQRIGPIVEIARGRARGERWSLEAYRASTRYPVPGGGSALCLSFTTGREESGFDCIVGEVAPMSPEELGVSTYGAGGGRALVGRVPPGVASVEFRALNDETTVLEIYPSPAELEVDFDWYIGFIGRNDSGTVVSLDATGDVMAQRRVCCPSR